MEDKVSDSQFLLDWCIGMIIGTAIGTGLSIAFIKWRWMDDDDPTVRAQAAIKAARRSDGR